MTDKPSFQPQDAQTPSVDGNGSQPPSNVSGVPLPAPKQFSPSESAEVGQIDQLSIHKSTSPRTNKQENDPQAIEVPPVSTNGNGSDEDQLTPVTKLANVERTEQPPARKATGPRTPQGKEKSKRNATKDGIFSSLVVLPGESREQVDSLLEDLWNTLQPEGKMEEILVDKIGANIWRLRRVIVAEGAEIRKGTELREFGLIRNIQDPDTRRRCVELLTKLQQAITSFGPQQGRDSAIIREIYGDESHLQTNLNELLSWLNRLYEWAEMQPQGPALATTPLPSFLAPASFTMERCKDLALQWIAEEISRLKACPQTSTSVKSDRIHLEMLRRSVPDSPRLDQLLRYETTLSRENDRILNRLERLQRIRKGQPLPPEVNVKVEL